MELCDEFELLDSMYPDEFEYLETDRKIRKKQDYRFDIILDAWYPEVIPRVVLYIPWVYWEISEKWVKEALEEWDIGEPMLAALVGNIVWNIPDAPEEEKRECREYVPPPNYKEKIEVSDN